MRRRSAIKTISAAGTGLFVSPFSIHKLFSRTGRGPREAWESLGKATRENYVFRYIEPDPELPKILIYGDSISIGYTEYVRSALDAQACTYRIHRNGSSSNEFIDYMETLRKTMFKPYLAEGWDFEWDLIHFNVGLHDLKYIYEGRLDKEKGMQVSSIPVYQENLRKIVEYLRESWPETKLVFATTTPVPENSNGRVAGDEKRYNEAAIEILAGYRGIRINDLHKLVYRSFNKLCTKPGNVHFKPEGSRLLGKQVARVIARELKIRTIPIPDDAILKRREQEHKSAP